MKKNYKWLIFPIILALFAVSCKKNSFSSDFADTDEWLIPESEIRDGGPGKDGIPALTNPPYQSAATAGFIQPGDLVIGLRIGDEIKAFPHKILDRHEIANDTWNGTPFILSYCPLTGTGMVWEAFSDSSDKSFGVSGLLYNSNLILYDRETDSLWSQMMMKCVNGPRIRTDTALIHVIETTWSTWRQLFPNAEVLSSNTGFNNSYDVYPYGSYKTSDSLLFPVSNEDNRLHKKERGHGVIVSDHTKFYPIGAFGAEIEVINEGVNGVEIVVAGSTALNLVVSFERMTADGTVLNFMPVQGELPVVMIDGEGTKWDVFGRGVSGPRSGSQLAATSSYNAYWFAWAAFFPGADIMQ